MSHKLEIRLFTIIISFVLLSILFQGCAPVFSEMQSARTVGKNRLDVTPTLSSVGIPSDESIEAVQYHIGIQAAYGLTEKIDIRSRYERIWLQDEALGAGVNVFGIGPKFGIVKDRVSIYLPIGASFDEGGVSNPQFHPTLLLSLPAIKNKLDLTLAPKYLISEGDNLFAVNFGASFSKNLNNWAIRAEYGLLFGGDSDFGQFSIGFTKAFGL
jgi:hypothetical protein